MYGIAAQGTKGGDVSGNYVELYGATTGYAGMILWGGNLKVHDNTIVTNCTGINAIGSTSLMTFISENTITATSGIDLQSGRFNVNNNDITASSSSWCITVESTSGHNIISQNNLNTGNGVLLQSNNNTVTENFITLTSSGFGVKVLGSSYDMILNNIIWNIGGGYNVDLEGTHKTRVAGNWLYTLDVSQGNIDTTGYGGSNCTGCTIQGNEFIAGKGIKNWGNSDNIFVVNNNFHQGNAASTYILSPDVTWTVADNYP
jgi:hypothetical protein